MSDVIGADASDQDIQRNLGTGQQESRSAAFGASVLASHPGSLAESQERYNAVLPRHYSQAGVAQIGQNARSALSLGLSPGDARSGVFAGQRYVLTSSNGRSASTRESDPRFAPGGEYR